MRFSERMVPEVFQTFWAAMQRGEFITDAAAEAGTYRKKGAWWVAADGGVRPRRGRNLKGRCLTLAQREEIAIGRARGDSIRSIAQLIGRSPSTVSRELRRNADGMGRYRDTSAHALAYVRASRSKPAKLATNTRLRGIVEADLAKKYSPGADRRPVEAPVPGLPGDAGVDRDDLPVVVCAVPRRPETGPDQVFEDRPGGA